MEGKATRSQGGIGSVTKVRHNLILQLFIYYYTVLFSQQAQLKNGCSKMEKELLW